MGPYQFHKTGTECKINGEIVTRMNNLDTKGKKVRQVTTIRKRNVLQMAKNIAT
jgi:hypothetical protein